MSITFAGTTDVVVFELDDMPEEINLGGENSGSQQLLGDGSKIFITTGDSPYDVTISGTLWFPDSQGVTPLEKIGRIDRMRQAREIVLVTTPAGPLGSCLITKCPYSLVKNMQITYQITLFRQVLGATEATLLGATATSSAQNTSLAAQQSVQRASSVVGATPDLASAMQDALSAQAAWQAGQTQLGSQK